MNRSATFTALLVLGLGSASWAAVVAPTRPSQLVTLRPGSACPGGILLETRIDADGTDTPFSIPPGQVLVLDHLTWTVNGVPSPGNAAVVVLKIDTQIVWSSVVALTGPSGTVGVSEPLPNIAVASGETVCLAVGSGGTINGGVSRLHGFLTRDK